MIAQAKPLNEANVEEERHVIRSFGDVAKLVSLVRNYADERGQQPSREEIAGSLGWSRTKLRGRLEHLLRFGHIVRDSESPWGYMLTQSEVVPEPVAPKLTPAQQQLAADHLEYAIQVADRFLKAFRADRHDIVSAAQMGLCRAAAKFDPHRGLLFKTYAAYRIKGEIHDTLRTMGVQSRNAKKRTGRPKTVSLFKPIGSFSESGKREHLIDELPDPSQASNKAIQEIDQANQFEHVASELGQAGEVVRLHYGGQEQSFREIADKFGLSPSRISQIHTQAINAIRRNPERFGLACERRVAQ